MEMINRLATTKEEKEMGATCAPRGIQRQASE